MAAYQKSRAMSISTIAILHCVCQAILQLTNGLPTADKIREYDDRWMHSGMRKQEPPRLQQSTRYVNEDAAFWNSEAQSTLRTRIWQKNIEKEAKNTILFLGDGMSLPTVTGSRIFKGQLEQLPNGGEEAQLWFDNFPHTALSKTYCTDSQVADSACSATAYLGGVKGNIGTIGVTNAVLRKDCNGQANPASQVTSILAWAQAAGKSTGIVTTARVTHASPAGTYAHVAERDWENDSDVCVPSSNKIDSDGLDSAKCEDIAEQLVLNEPGRKINVILGGGRRNFFNESVLETETGKGGSRVDGKNLVETWKENKHNAIYITRGDELLAVDSTKTDYLLGLFSADHMGYKDQMANNNEPSLAQMTEAAIKILSKNPNGFFLFVEGAKIDMAHHSSNSQRALMETLEFDKAISLADELTSDENTLLVVTADHAHVMTISGYPVRGSPLLGISQTGDDGKPYGTLSYANGPGYREPVLNPQTGKCDRVNLTSEDFTNILYKQVGMVPISSETHGGDDVGIFAKGPWAHLFSGVLQQNYIPHAMAYAACIGKGAKFCSSGKHNSYLYL